MAGRAPVSAGSRLLERFHKWYYNAQGFNKYGLRRDDILNETDVVKEAIKRLPPDVYYERIFRIKRAVQLSVTHEILPKDQWTKYEETKQYCTQLKEQDLLTLYPGVAGDKEQSWH